MKTKDLAVMALFIGIGAILHAIIPSSVGTMKPDFSLIMMFLGIILFPNRKNVLLLGIATGIISGLTSAIGLMPNLIDKFITAFVFYGLYLLVKKSRSVIINGILAAIGTLISGTVFLSSALVITGLPAAFMMMFTGAVLPAILVNTIVIVIMYPIVTQIAKRAKVIEYA